MLFNQAVARYDSQISDIKAQIEALREKLSQVEADRQNLLATEQMWESAIAQITAAKAATEAIGQTNLVDDAKAAIDAVFSELPQLTAWDEAEAEIMEMEPQKPIDPTEGVIPENTEATEAEAIDVTSDVVAEAKATEAEKPAYHSLIWREFLKYAKSKGINTKGKTRGEIELELMNQVK
ncbi:MAG TPA: hypothetical protein VK203_22630 [Nostocaceae cyanobacterium]|nr:hypothetical protein [Nostocaceae cyanobacterium]